MGSCLSRETAYVTLDGVAMHSTSSAHSRVGAPDVAWTAASWLSTLDGLSETIVACLLGTDRPEDELAAMRALGAAAATEAQLEAKLRSAGVLAALAKALHPPLAELVRAEVVTGSALHDKFAQDDKAFKLMFGDLSTFFGGLEAKIGPPRPKVREAMEEEHTAASDSLDEFKTANYGVTTTPTLEWWFVTEPEKQVEWPVEEKLRDSPEKMRKPMPLAELEQKMDELNVQLKEMGEPVLLLDEGFAARLYTGPMRVAARHAKQCM